MVWVRYQSAKPLDVVNAAVLRTCQPSATRSAPDVLGYQKWPPVSGSVYDAVPISASGSIRRSSDSISGLPCARNTRPATATRCIMKMIAVDGQP